MRLFDLFKSKKEIVKNKEITKEEVFNEILAVIVGDKVEKKEQLNTMLKDIKYLTDKEKNISKTTKCEILEYGDYQIKDKYIDGNNIVISYELDFILQTFIERVVAYRVQATCSCIITFPESDYINLEIDGRMSKQQMLKYKDKVNFLKIEYEWVECDEDWRTLS